SRYTNDLYKLPIQGSSQYLQMTFDIIPDKCKEILAKPKQAVQLVRNWTRANRHFLDVD
ncbi:hypothetical protein JTB14_019952, partial [Gonioctena quinquepunctata]